MKICLLRHPGTVHMRRWIKHFAARGHDVHIVYFEGDLGLDPQVEEDFPDIAHLKNVHIHRIRYDLDEFDRLRSTSITSGRETKERLRLLNRSNLDCKTKLAKKAKAICRPTTTFKKLRYARLSKTLNERTMVKNSSKTIAGVIRLMRTLRQIGPDVLHAHTANYYGYMGAMSGFHPFILSAWGSDVLAAPEVSESSKKRVLFALREADVITTTADFLKGYLIDRFQIPSGRIMRIPWGIDLNVFCRGYQEEVERLRERLGISTASPVILSNRSMAPQYEIDRIVDAVPYVVQEFADVVFVFIRGYGGQEFENEMRSRAKRLGVLTSIRFIPRLVEPQEMAVYLNMAIAFVSIPRYGQFGASILEGMACGSMPIVSNIEVHRTLLWDGKNAYLVNPQNEQDIAAKTIHAIGHPELRDKFYQTNRLIVEEKENWERNAIAMEELYQSLIRKRFWRLRKKVNNLLKDQSKLT